MPLGRRSTQPPRRGSSTSHDLPHEDVDTGELSLVEAPGTNFVHVVRASTTVDSTNGLPSSVVVTTELSASTAAWVRHVEKLSESEKRLFLRNEVGDLGAYLGSVEHDTKDQELSSRASRIAKLFKPIVQAVDMYAPALQTISQGGPAPAAYVLGGITCLMGIPLRFLDYQEKIATMLCEMGVEFRRLSEYERTLFRDNYEVQEALLDVYGDILDFCREAAKLVYDEKGKPKGSLKTFTLSLWKPYEAKLGAIQRRFESHLKDFEKLADLVIRKNTAIFFASMSQDMKQIKRDNTSIKSTLDSMNKQIPSEMRRGLLQDSVSRDAERRRMSPEKRERVLAWIPNVSYETFHRARLAKRLNGTGQWLLDDVDFKKWKENPDESNVLCVQGKSGCGKSCLAALVVDSLRHETASTNQTTAVANVYCGDLDDTNRSREWIFGSILHQLLARDKEFGADRAIERIYDTNGGKPPNPDQLEELISSVAGRFQKVYIVVDGLDECYRLGDEAFGNFCNSIKSFARLTPSTIRVAIFSRPNYAPVEKVFQSCPHVEVDTGKNEDDIKQFIASVLSEEELMIRNNKTLLQYVEKTLLSKADGMFLWVSMLTQTLKSAQSASEIKEKIEDLPLGLHGVYEISLQRILQERSKSVRSRAMKLLLWVTNAKRALSKEEMIEALVIEPGMNDLDRDAMVSQEAAITAQCGDLVVLRDGFYYPLHSSLQDYLLKLTKEAPNHLQEFRQMQLDANKILGEACLTYLQFDKFMDGPVQDPKDLETFKKENPFFGYAARYWGSHIVAAGESGYEELIENLLSCDESRELSMQQYVLTDAELKDAACPYRGSTTPLHILAIFNLSRTAQSLIQEHESKFKLDGFDRLPIDYALAGKSREMCLWVLQKSADADEEINTDFGRYSPIHMAANNDWGDVIERLVAAGYDLETKIGTRSQTPLHIAASMGCESAVDTLLKLKAKVDAYDTDYQTPLIDAAEGNHYKVIEKLLKAGANVNQRGWQGLTALHRVAVSGNLQAAQKLFRYKPDVDPKADEGWSSRTPFHIAAEDNHPELLRFLHSKGATLEAECVPKFTPLLLAAAAGSLGSLNQLLEWKVNLDARNATDETAMHLAALNGYSEVIKALYQAKKEYIEMVDEFGETPLHSAIRANKLEAAMALLECNSSIEATDPKGQNALHLAIIEGNTQLVEHLIRNLKADTSAKGVTGAPALHYAASYHHKHMIRTLIVDGGADPDAANENGQTALHFAARENDIDFIKELVEVAPSVNLSPLDKQNRTPLHLAADEGATEVIKYLFEQNVSINKNADKNTPFNLAAWSGDLESVKLLLINDNINDGGYYGRTALFGASTRGHVDVVRFLLEKGADPDVADDFDQSPLFTATKNRRMEVAKILIDAKADGNTKTRWGRTALHEAASAGDCEISKKLLEAGCDGLVLSVWGDTPFLCAVDADNAQLVDIFLDKSCNGTELINHQNVNVYHIAVGKGNMEMFEKLLKAGKPTAAQISIKDHLDRDLMYYAATGGHVDMLHRLQGLEIGLNGRDSIRPPLYEAASCGYVHFVSELINGGADLEAVCHHDQRTALMAAAMDRKPITMEKLLLAGANPFSRDDYGYSALDYAHKASDMWSVVSSYHKDYKEPDPAMIRKSLRNVVANATREILKLPETHNAQVEAARVPLMVLVTNALIELEEGTDYETSLILLKEIANPPEISFFSVTWDCNMCSQPATRKSKLMCKTCQNVFLCDECHALYLKGDESPKSAPKAYKVMEKLEVDLRPLRLVASSCADLGVRFLGTALDLLTRVDKLITEKTKEYNDWKKDLDKDGRYDSQPKPGLQFLKIIEKTRKLMRSLEENPAPNDDESKIEPNQPTNDDKPKAEKEADAEMIEEKDSLPADFEGLDEELVKLFRLHKADQEISPFICSGHDFLEVPYIDWAKAEKDLGPYDSIGRVTHEWLAELLKTYEQDETKQDQSLSLDGEVNDLYAEPIDLEEELSVKTKETVQQTPVPREIFPKRTLTASQLDETQLANKTSTEKQPNETVPVLEPEFTLSRRATDLLGDKDAVPNVISSQADSLAIPSKKPTLDELERVSSNLMEGQNVHKAAESSVDVQASASSAVNPTTLDDQVTKEDKTSPAAERVNKWISDFDFEALMREFDQMYIQDLRKQLRQGACEIITRILTSETGEEKRLSNGTTDSPDSRSMITGVRREVSDTEGLYESSQKAFSRKGTWEEHDQTNSEVSEKTSDEIESGKGKAEEGGSEDAAGTENNEVVKSGSHAYRVLTQMNLWSVGYQFGQVVVQGSVTDNLIPGMDALRLLKEEGFLKVVEDDTDGNLEAKAGISNPKDYVEAAQRVSAIVNENIQRASRSDMIPWQKEKNNDDDKKQYESMLSGRQNAIALI